MGLFLKLFFVVVLLFFAFSFLDTVTGNVVKRPPVVTETCQEYRLSLGESIVVGGKTVMVTSIDTDGAFFDVGGTIEGINDGQSETINNLRIEVLTVFDDNYVIIKICERRTLSFPGISRVFDRVFNIGFTQRAIPTTPNNCRTIDLSMTVFNRNLTGNDFCRAQGYANCNRLTAQGNRMMICTNTILCNNGTSRPYCWINLPGNVRGYDSIECCGVQQTTTPPPIVPVTRTTRG